MRIPNDVIDRLGLYPEDKVIGETASTPIVFIRSAKGVVKLNPNSDKADLLRTFMSDPTRAPMIAKRLYRQAIVLRTIAKKRKHYPLWALFSDRVTQERLGLKHNQETPRLNWVYYKRELVANYLDLKTVSPALEHVYNKVDQ